MSKSFKYTRLSKNDAACLLVDHQSGLISLVQDFSPGEFKNNVLALAASAKYFKLPTILTTSFENGPNGPLVPELKDLFPDAPYHARGRATSMPGTTRSSWRQCAKTGRNQLIFAGVVTEVCVAFPSALCR
jgi:nicotinamidase-related amidase